MTLRSRFIQSSLAACVDEKNVSRSDHLPPGERTIATYRVERDCSVILK